MKMKCLNLKCHGNPKSYIEETQDLRKRLFALAGDTMDKAKTDIFDFDLIQAILLNLPAKFQAFITIFRADPKMDFEEFTEQILMEERQMKPNQETTAMAANVYQEKWQKKRKRK